MALQPRKRAKVWDTLLQREVEAEDFGDIDMDKNGASASAPVVDPTPAPPPAGLPSMLDVNYKQSSRLGATDVFESLLAFTGDRGEGCVRWEPERHGEQS